jgi:hypothetical protein
MMKHLTKISAALLICTGLLYSACKKTENKGTAASKTNYLALSKQLALSIKGAMTAGSTGFKSAGTGSKRVNDINSHLNCGAVDFTPYYNVTTVNDTTRTDQRNTYFTYICNDNVLNEYALLDSSKYIESGTGFNNTFNTIQKYNVKALNTGYTVTTSNGLIYTDGMSRKLTSQGGTGDYYGYTTRYGLNNVIVTRTDDGPALTGGSSQFEGTTLYCDSSTDANGVTEVHNGIIYFLPDNIIKVAFYGPTGLSRYYEINTKTGEAKEL